MEWKTYSLKSFTLHLKNLNELSNWVPTVHLARSLGKKYKWKRVKQDKKKRDKQMGRKVFKQKDKQADRLSW